MKRTLYCLGLICLSLTTSDVMATHLETRIKMLEEQLLELRSMIAEEKAKRAEDDNELAKQNAVLAADNAKLAAKVAKVKKKGRNIKLGDNTTLSYGGFIKYNATYDDYQDGAIPGPVIASRILVPSLIPVGNSAASESPKFNSDVATSRFFFKTETETRAGPITSYVELDFLSGGGDERISNSNNSRIRHAFFDWKYSDTDSLKIGQTWSTFFNVGALPEAVDFIGPTSGSLFNRQQIIRWTRSHGDGRSFMLALENPSTSLADSGSGIDNNNLDDNSIPDIVARYNGKSKSGKHSYAVSVVGREIAIDDGVFDDSEYSAAVNFAGKYVFGNGDDIRYSLAYGTLGRYIALNAFDDGALDASGNIDLTDVFGGYVAYRHLWNSKLRSTFQYAFSEADLADGLADTNTEEVSNINVSLMYSPTPKLTFGGAVIQANRELANGIDGDLTRFQFTGVYKF